LSGKAHHFWVQDSVVNYGQVVGWLRIGWEKLDLCCLRSDNYTIKDTLLRVNLGTTNNNSLCFCFDFKLPAPDVHYSGCLTRVKTGTALRGARPVFTNEHNMAIQNEKITAQKLQSSTIGKWTIHIQKIDIPQKQKQKQKQHFVVWSHNTAFFFS